MEYQLKEKNTIITFIKDIKSRTQALAVTTVATSPASVHL